LKLTSKFAFDWLYKTSIAYMLCASKNPPKYPEPIVLKMLLTQAKSTKRKQTKKKVKRRKKKY